jgi:hypothetical protein
MFRIKTEKNLVDLVNPVKEVRPQGAKLTSDKGSAGQNRG